MTKELTVEDVEKKLEEMYQIPSGSKTILKSNAGYHQLGSVFEAETVKGNKNYVIFMFCYNDWVYYCHGDKAKKVKKDHFLKLIDYGDLIPVPPEKVDPERKSLAVIGMLAMANGITFNDYLKVYYGVGHGSTATEYIK
jgi:hypothetical protein